MSRSALETPMMQQFLAIKAQHPDAIVFYRMGDFYEMFLHDAEQAAPLLDIALTSRDKGKEDAVPMCGVPVHSADQYIKKLTDAGHRVAICEQIEDPKLLSGRRLVKRDVVEVVTPGLVGDPSGLAGERVIALVAIHPGRAGEPAGLASLDATTGDFRATEAPRCAADGAGLPGALWEEIERISPQELVLPEPVDESLRDRLRVHLPSLVVSAQSPALFEPSSVTQPPEGFSSDDEGAASCAAAALLGFLAAHQPFALDTAPPLRRYGLQETMVLDAATCTHLELFESNEDRTRRGTLIERIDATRTPLGARRLARWLGYPLLVPEEIRRRHDAVATLADRDRARGRLRDALKEVRDLERLLAKALRPGSVPRDLGNLRSSLRALPRVVESLAVGEGEAPAEGDEWLGAEPAAALPVPEPLPALCSLLEEALIDDPPVIAKGSRGAHETGYIRAGFRSDLDGIRESAEKGREWIAGLEAQERERTGIATLKVRYHPVHGYSLEVSKTQLAKVPEHYVRKQTLANVERFTTEELREVEGRVMGANERAASLEREIFESVRMRVAEDAQRIRDAATAVGELDALASLAEVARRDGWVKPSVDAGERTVIRAGRHPVVEAMLRARGSDGFVPNDSELDPGGAQIWLLTGPNMSGKSTYLRQVALITLLAQIGSFVPAEAAEIGVVDRIFTRVGASDRLARGESTFMVEMRETAEILQKATRRSLVILDEIGRGTSTYDGLAIAWAVAEQLHDGPGLSPRTLFATHYHELTDLALTKDRVRNAHFEVREWKEEVVFLRRLVEGGASRSYGIQVARLAGIPDAVIRRAKEILANLEGGELDPAGRPRWAGPAPEGEESAGQLALFQSAPALSAVQGEVLGELERLDPDRMTPMDALEALQRFRQRLGEEGAE